MKNIFVFVLALLLLNISPINAAPTSPKNDMSLGNAAEIENWLNVFSDTLWVIQIYEPYLYEEITTQIEDDINKQRSDSEIMWGILKRYLTLQRKFIPYATLETIDLQLAQNISQLDYLIENNFDSCVVHLSENRRMIETYKILPKKLINNSEIMEKAILSYYENPADVGDKVIAQPIFIDVIMSFSRDERKILKNVLQNPVASTENPITTCKLYRNLLSKIQKLDNHKRSILLRYLLS